MSYADRRELTWAWCLLLLSLALLASWVAIRLTPEGYPVAAWWPAAGITAALVALAPLRRAPLLAVAVAATVLAANVVADRDAQLAWWLAAGAGVEALVAGLLLKGLRDRRPRLDTNDDLVRLAAAAVAAALLFAVIAAVAVPRVTEAVTREVAAMLFFSHLSAVLTITPVALARHRGHREGSEAEGFLQGAFLVVVTAAVFLPDQPVSLSFAPLPVLVWGALRFSVRRVAWQLAAFAAVSTAVTARGAGPFGEAVSSGELEPLASAALTQGYLVSAAVLTLPLAIAVRLRHQLLTRVSADERLFRRNFTESLVGMLLLRLEGDSLLVAELNERAVETLGGDREALVGRPLDELLVCPERLSGVVAEVQRGHREGWTGSCGVTERPGAHVEVALAPLSDAEQGAIFSAQVLDVTVEHQTRQRLEAAEKLTSATLDTAACIILVTDTDGRIVRVNAATTEITGYRETELLGRSVWETPVSPSDTNDIEALFVWPNRSGQPVIRERDLVTKDGQRLRVVWNNNVVRDDHGFATYAVMTGIDVTTERTSAGLVTHLMQAAISTALVGVGRDGLVTVFNSGACHLLGYEAQEVVGQPFARLLDREQLVERTGTADPGRSFAVLAGSVGTGGETGARDWTWVSRAGQHRVVSMTLSATEDAFGEQVGYLVVGRDVTEQRASQELLVAALEKERTAVDRLRALDEAKNEFVSTVSHELRTPVTSIVGYTEMLQDGSLVEPHPDQLPLLDSVARNGQRLIALCGDLLELSGLDAGTTQWQRDAVDLGAVLGPVEESVRPLLTGRRLRVRWAAPPAPVVVTGDRAQLERVLLNLVSNAVKFTEDGGSVSCRVGSDGHEAVLEVADTGIGIPRAEQEGLFQKFFRSTTAQEKAIQGTGLGLSIVSAIVSAHGGRVEVDSDHMEGTTFTVRLPLAA